mmetsp:Transcript_6947/g.19783  ORF Transcript_6947/g.19783 Transcript_6947/m.19783 type:complete len:211 (+) Transcript_6947:94-726(+)
MRLNSRKRRPGASQHVFSRNGRMQTPRTPSFGEEVCGAALAAGRPTSGDSSEKHAGPRACVHTAEGGACAAHQACGADRGGDGERGLPAAVVALELEPMLQAPGGVCFGDVAPPRKGWCGDAVTQASPGCRCRRSINAFKFAASAGDSPTAGRTIIGGGEARRETSRACGPPRLSLGPAMAFGDSGGPNAAHAPAGGPSPEPAFAESTPG